MVNTKQCHTWLIEEMDATFAAVAIELHNLDALLYEIDHADCVCGDCMEIARSTIERLSKIAKDYEIRWKNIEIHKSKTL